MNQQMHHQMRQMDSLMNSMMMDPFGMMGMGRMGMGGGNGFRNPREMMMIEDVPRGGNNQIAERRSRGGRGGFDESNMMMMPFGGLLGGGGLFGGLMQQMQNMQQAAVNDPNCHVYTQSTVVSMAPNERGEPSIYEATKSVRRAGDVKEVRRTVRDSERGVDRMSIGHHIGDRAHIIEKERDRSGQIREQQQFRNLHERTSLFPLSLFPSFLPSFPHSLQTMRDPLITNGRQPLDRV